MFNATNQKLAQNRTNPLSAEACLEQPGASEHTLRGMEIYTAKVTAPVVDSQTIYK